jgi:eukaryotic-like serine/threonine-protein kinase
MAESAGSDRARRIDRLFVGALERAGRARQDYLAAECGDDAQLRADVEALLAAAEAGDDPFERPVEAVREHLWRTMLATSDDAEENLSGQRFQNWRIDRRIARGGLATVYLAHRDDGEFAQLGAFKVLRRGLDTDDLVSRFRAERQILSSLEHPSIARILDGGALPDGRPYLVLEYLDGLPITEYCRSRNVDLAGRLRLMIRVLRALHHAHRHLVVHRDVKPSNILVADEGDVKLLDFGIAKLLDGGHVGAAATHTRTGVALLTPGCGSPEQHAGGVVTTASDIYQAGLVLYELLTDEFPFAGSPVATRFVVPPPSERLRHTALYRQVRGDLDAITRRAAHADPTQRYASADEMLRDLERYLAGWPVQAQPDTLAYRVQKLAARNPWLLPLAGLLLVGVIGYVVTLTAYSSRLEHERQLAASVQQFMVELFRSPDPFAPADPERGRDIRVVEALELGLQRVRTELADQSELRAALVASIAGVYASLDQHRAAIDLRTEALALESGLYGPRSAQVAASLRALSGSHAQLGDMERAGELVDQQLDIAQASHSTEPADLAVAQIAVGLHEHQRGNLERSQAMLLEGVSRLRAMPTAHPHELLEALITLEQQRSFAATLMDFDPLREAGQVARQAFGADSLQAALVQVRLASSMTNRGEYDASEQTFLAAIPVLEARLGKNHGSTLGALNNLGYLYHAQGDLGAAERIHRELLARNLAKHGEWHRAVGDSYQNLASAIMHQGRFEESLPLHRKAYETFKTVLNDDNYVTAIPLLSIAYAQLQLGDAPAAEAAAREALERLQATSAARHLEGVARCLAGLGLEQQGRVAEGAAMVAASHALIGTANLPDAYPELCRLSARRED